MYTIIPINETEKLNVIKFEDVDCAIIGLETISKLIAYEDYPIANKKIAISNILDFLKYVDVLLNNKTLNTTMNIVTISSKELIKHFTTKHYKRYMEIFKKLEIMTVVPYSDGTYYQVKDYNQQYKLYNKYIFDKLCFVFLNLKQYDLVIDYPAKYDKKFISTIKNIEVDYVSAINAEIQHHLSENTTIKSLKIRLNTLFSLNTRRFIYKGFSVDRIYHSLSNISRISRKYLHIDGYKFNDVDVKNCQPLLLCYLIKKKQLKLDDNYKYDCESTQIYERFVKSWRDRNKTKVEMYRTIYFDFKPDSDLAKEFKELYPLTYESLEILSNDKDVKIASQLQNLESQIFNTIIPKKSKYFYPLFDSIYFTDIEDCGRIVREIKDKFLVYDIKATLTINGETENDTEDCIN